MPTVTMNEKKAKKLEVRAREEYDAGNATDEQFAQVHLALAKYLTLTREFEKAVLHLTEAAKLGNHGAMLELGCCFRDGKGVDVNPQQAFDYFKQAMGGDDPKVRSLAVQHIAMLLISDAKKARAIPKTEGDSWFRETFHNADFSNFQYYLTTASFEYQRLRTSQPTQSNSIARLIDKARKSLSPLRASSTPATAREREPLLSR